MELKHDFTLNPDADRFCINRTFMELKQLWMGDVKLTIPVLIEPLWN